MESVIVFILGWPAIAISLVVAIVGVCKRNQKLITLALALSLPICSYLIGANNWLQLIGIGIPGLFCFVLVALNKRWRNSAKLAVLVIGLFYACLAFVVFNQ